MGIQAVELLMKIHEHSSPTRTLNRSYQSRNSEYFTLRSLVEKEQNNICEYFLQICNMSSNKKYINVFNLNF